MMTNKLAQWWRRPSRREQERLAFLVAIEAIKNVAVASSSAAEEAAALMRDMLDSMKVSSAPEAQIDHAELWRQQEENRLIARGITVDADAKRRLSWLAGQLDD